MDLETSAPALESEAAIHFPGPGGESQPRELPPDEHVPRKPCSDGAFTSISRAGTIGCGELKEPINHVLHRESDPCGLTPINA